jgi:hypothetical protein
MALIKPIPYTTCATTASDAEAAAWFRAQIVPHVKRRIKGHHLGGFKADFLVSAVAAHKRRLPWFVRTDITRFYPHIRHEDVHPHVTIGYKKLLSLPHVPRAFELQSRKLCTNFLRSLGMPKGLPLGNAMSTILAPAMLIPLWMDLRARFQVPFIVFMDDILLFAQNERQTSEMWAFLCNRLADDYGLEPNLNKTISGRFADTAVDFAGWNFAGGYARIANEKLNTFSERFTQTITLNQDKPLRAMIKNINRRIDGFGNHYKHGNTAKQYETLDKQIRRLLRIELRRRGLRADTTNDGLRRLGFRTLTDIYQRKHSRRPNGRKLRAVGHAPDKPLPSSGVLTAATDAVQLERIAAGQATIIALMKKQLKAIERLYCE